MNFIVGLGIAMIWMLLFLCIMWVFIKTHLWIPLFIIFIIIGICQFVSETINIGRHARKLIKEKIKNTKIR